jgi:glycerol-3-phosphate dehydrogenase
MAKLAVDRIVEREGREAPCRTEDIPIGLPANPDDLPDLPGVETDTRAHLAARYGHAARDVLRLASAAPHLTRRISPDLPDIAAEPAFAAGHEQARSLADALLRRTRLGLLDARRLAAPGSEGARLAARAMGGELGWDEARLERELRDWGTVAGLEGLVKGGAEPPARAGTGDEAPLRAGAAPEEAA